MVKVENDKLFAVFPLYEDTDLIICTGGERCYLLKGTDAALLIDTGIGYGSLKQICKKRTKLPITVVNTHGHLDHCGGNSEFESCMIHEKDYELMKNSVEMSRRIQYIKRFICEDAIDVSLFPKISAQQPQFIKDGDIIHLGNRDIEVFEVPGHTYGTVVLLDREKKCIFSGDVCNKNTLLNLNGSATVKEYLTALERFAKCRKAFEWMFSGHENKVSTNVLLEGIELCQEIIDRKDDKISNGIPGQFYAKAKVGDFVRTDGKYVNIVYREDRIG